MRDGDAEHADVWLEDVALVPVGEAKAGDAAFIRTMSKMLCKCIIIMAMTEKENVPER